MAERTEDQVLDQVVYAVACAYRHYGPGLSEDGLRGLRALLRGFTRWTTDSSYRMDVHEDDPQADFASCIAPRYGRPDYAQVVADSRGEEL